MFPLVSKTSEYEKQLMVETAGLLGGLVQQMRRRSVVPLQSGFISGKSVAQACDCALGTTHCYRSSSQRSLSTPVRILGDRAIPAPGDSLYFASTFGSGMALGQPPIVIYDANVQAARERIQGLVLIGLRTNTQIIVNQNEGTTIPAAQVNINPDALAKRLARMFNSYHVLRIQWSSDTQDPWVSDTLLEYWDRPAHESFLPIPPVRWKGRDARITLEARGADFPAPLATPEPEMVSTVYGYGVQAYVRVETLWIPDPAYCGRYWPGEICPPSQVSVSGVKTPGAMKRFIARLTTSKRD